MPDIQVTDHTDRHRFEITSDGASAGFADYELSEGRIEFTHTVVRDEFEGQGIGGKLISHALDSARSRDLRVTPTCSFVKGYVEKHPAYADLVD